MGVVLSVLCFLAVYVAGRRSLGRAVGLVVAIGCAYGLVRAYFSSFYFAFDAAVVALYLVAIRTGAGRKLAQRSLGIWVVTLCSFPVLLILLSPFFEGQPLLVQMLGLRSAIFFVPLALVGAMLEEDEWLEVSRWAAWTVLFCAAVAIAELVFGVEAIIPENASSKLVYSARDVGGIGAFRIPATFVSSHAYSGTMLGMMPILLRRVESLPGRRILNWAALLAASFGALVSGARMSVIVFAAMFAVVIARSTKRPGLFRGLVVVLIALAVVVPRTAQFRRVETLEDPDVVSERFGSSVNVSVLDAVGRAPLGSGLGMAFGTSIPYFLADSARPQIGMESEYARIAVEQGLLGLALWVCFIGWALLHLPNWTGRAADAAGWAMWIFCASSWVGGVIGTGVLASVPLTMLLLLQMGALVERKARHSALVSRVGAWPVPLPFASLHSREPSAPRLT